MHEPAESAASAIMLFDGECMLCNDAVALLLAHSSPNRLRFCPMESEGGQVLLTAMGFPTRDFETLVVIEQRGVTVKSEAILRLASLIDAPWPAVARLLRIVPRRWRDWLYDRVAANRHGIWRQTSACMLADPAARRRFLLRMDSAGHGPVDSGVIARLGG